MTRSSDKKFASVRKKYDKRFVMGITIENEFLFRSVFLLNIIGSSSQPCLFRFNCPVVGLDV